MNTLRGLFADAWLRPCFHSPLLQLLKPGALVCWAVAAHQLTAVSLASLPDRRDLCVKDPCTCCTYEVTACVPACCGDAAPTLVCCRSGLFGRKVLTYAFADCDHTVDVVITAHGRTIVRD